MRIAFLFDIFLTDAQKMAALLRRKKGAVDKKAFMGNPPPIDLLMEYYIHKTSNTHSSFSFEQLYQFMLVFSVVITHNCITL